MASFFNSRESSKVVMHSITDECLKLYTSYDVRYRKKQNCDKFA